MFQAKSMRCGVVLIFTLALSLICGFSPSMRDKFDTIRRDCQQEIKISNEDLENIRKVILNDDSELQKCYLKCVLKSLNFMDKSGKFTPKKGLSTLPPEMASVLKPSIDVCNTLVSDNGNACEKAMKIYRCIQTKFPSITKFL